MAQIPRKYVNNYTKAVSALSTDAKARVGEALKRLDLSDPAAAREAIIDLMELHLGPYTDMAAVTAAEFYDGLREMSIGAKIGALADSRRVPEATEGAVRAFVQDIVDGKPRETLEGKIIGRVDAEIRRAANECVAYNAKRDGVPYARVPMGTETCSFCLMLASKGPVKGDVDTASHTHANCDCKIVPDFGDGIEGYDKEYWYDRWAHPEKYRDMVPAAAKGGAAPYTEAEISAIAKARTKNQISGNFGAIVRGTWDDTNVAITGVDPLKDNMIDFVDSQIKSTWGSTWDMMPHLIEEIGQEDAVAIFNSLTGRDYDAYMRFAVQRGWLDQVDVDYVCLLDKYSGTTNYKAINSWLRGDYDAIYGPMDEAWVDSIDRVIASQTLDKPLEVTRYYREFPDELKAEFAQGGVFSDKAYMSTTLADDHLFIENSVATVHVSVPPGKGRGVYIDGVEEVVPNHHWDAEAGKVDGEKEFLIRRDAKFKVAKYEENEGRVEVWLEMIE